MENFCKCTHHRVIPFLIVAFGVSFFMGFLGITSWDTVSILWPLLVVLGGLTMFIDKSEMCKCASSGKCCGC